MEGEVRRDGGLGSQAAEDAGGREHAAEAVAGRRHTGQCGIEGPFGKEMVTPAAERKAVAHLVDAYGMSERQACTPATAYYSRSRYRPEGQARFRRG
jgi:putative transposase